MAYLCPVCEQPQVDAGHLANHLAFTALIRGADHEGWLAEHAPDWADHDEAWLAERLRETVEPVDHPVDEIEGHDHDGGHDHEQAGGRSAQDPAVAADRLDGSLDGEARAIVEEAREMTREMAADGTSEDDDGSAEGETE